MVIYLMCELVGESYFNLILNLKCYFCSEISNKINTQRLQWCFFFVDLLGQKETTAQTQEMYAKYDKENLEQSEKTKNVSYIPR